MFSRLLIKVVPVVLVALCLVSCNKKGDFIPEDKIGSGVHYYPVIIDEPFVDTLTGKYLNETDTTFTPGQKIIFEMDYFSKDRADSLELWAGKSQDHLQKVLAIPYNFSLYSTTKGLDTVLFSYTLPQDLDTQTKWYMQPRVSTQDGLVSSAQQMTLRIQ